MSFEFPVTARFGKHRDKCDKEEAERTERHEILDVVTHP
jgi:hypothetical protein